MKLPSKLAEPRDKLAFKYAKRWSCWKDLSEEEQDETLEDYASMFNAACEILLPQLEKLTEALIDVNEFTECHLETMKHYFDNKCLPTIDEVTEVEVVNSQLKLVIGSYKDIIGDE